ncbi:MAG: DUF6268 family outer membrane beta-barrel protein [Desulfonatronovibrionaceae bacterium]
MQSKTFLYPVLILWILWALPVQASQPAAQGTRLSASVEYDHGFKAEAKDKKTELSSSGFRLRADYSYFTLGYEYLHYSWDNPEKTFLTPGSARPWQDLHRINMAARKNFQINEKWSFNLGAGMDAAFEQELDESLGARADFSVIRNFGRGWTAGIGAAGFYHPVKSRVFPALSIRYYPAELPGFGMNIGFPEASLEYFFHQAASVKAFAAISSRTYRLKDKNRVSPEGYFRDQAFKTGIAAKTSLGDSLTFNVSAYLLVDRKIRIYDHNKSKIMDLRLESSPGAAISLDYTF